MVLLTLDAGDGEPLVLPLIVTVATSVVDTVADADGDTVTDADGDMV